MTERKPAAVVRTYAVGLLVAAGASIALAMWHPFGNPRLAPAEPREALLRASALPDDARNALVTKCADCHSETTHWPVYAHLAPMSWMLDVHVMKGRQHMDLSHWDQLSADEQQTLKQEIAHVASNGSMPPKPYALIHWNARLSAADREALKKLAPADAGDPGAPAAAGDATRGQALFEKRCTGCHATDEDREGPRLRGVYGRKAAAVAGFSYTPSLKGSGVTWTDSSLDRWLTDSDAMIAGSGMGFVVAKAQDRADLIAYLKSLK